MDWASYSVVVAGAALATLGFAVLINVPRRCLPFAVLVGIAGQVVSRLARDMGHSPEAAAFAGGLTVGMLAEVGARLFHTPVTTFTISGFVSLVPGTLAFRAMKELLDNQFIVGLVFALRALLLGGSLAAGIGVSTALNQLRRPGP